jgi:hypothetical protein
VRVEVATFLLVRLPEYLRDRVARNDSEAGALEHRADLLLQRRELGGSLGKIESDAAGTEADRIDATAELWRRNAEARSRFERQATRREQREATAGAETESQSW